MAWNWVIGILLLPARGDSNVLKSRGRRTHVTVTGFVKKYLCFSDIFAYFFADTQTDITTFSPNRLGGGSVKIIISKLFKISLGKTWSVNPCKILVVYHISQIYMLKLNQGDSSPVKGTSKNRHWQTLESFQRLKAS